MRTPLSLLIFFGVSAVTATAIGQDVGPIQRLGLLSAQFTTTNGYQSSAVYQLTESGYVRGNSRQFEGGSTTSVGTVSWFANAHTGVTATIGLFDSEFLTANGFSNGSFQYLTNDGFMGGTQVRTPVNFVEQGSAVWLASAAEGITKRVGFTSGEFTKSDGYQGSSISQVIDSGIAAGSSQRFSGGSTNLGTAAWIANYAAGVTTRVGFYSALYTQSDGYQESLVQKLTTSGYAVGTSTSYQSATAIGVDAWVANAKTGATTLIGLGTGFLNSSTGPGSSKVLDISESGYIFGSTRRKFGGGDGVWIASAATGATTRVGFFSAGYVSTGGGVMSAITAVSEGGYAVGTSERLFGSSSTKGYSGWIASGQTGLTTQIGLISSEFTSADGTQRTTPWFVNNTGLSAGTSERYLGNTLNTDSGKAAWVANPSGTTTRIGLTGAAFTSSDNFQNSDVTQLTNSGYIVGRSLRYNGDWTHYTGYTLWAATAAGTTNAIGLYGTGYISSSGLQLSSFKKITESGLVIGKSQKYNGVAPFGETPWVARADTGVTTALGLTGSAFTSTAGLSNSSVGFVTESGLVGGVTTRYRGENSNGQSAWIFDLTTQSYTDLTLSVRADGYASTLLIDLNENGFAFGTYTKFDTAGLYVGTRTFAWIPGSGAFDLGDAVDGGLQPAGWSDLYSTAFGNSSGVVIGLGDRITNSGIAVYATQVAVPESSIFVYISLGGLFLLFWAKKRPRSISNSAAGAGIADALKWRRD